MAAADLTLHIDRIKGDPNNVRSQVDVKAIKGLADSIKGVGLLNPIIVRPEGDGYVVIAGHRRLAAIGTLVDAGEHDGEIPVILRSADITEAEVTVEQLVENLQREDISVLDEAAGYARLLEFDMSQADIARKVGRSRAHVTKRLALLSLPEEAKAALRKGDIKIEQALAIAALDEEDQAEYVARGDWSQWELQRLLRGAKGKKAAAKMAEDLAALGLEVFDPDGQPVAEWEAPEGYRYLSVATEFSDSWDGSIPEGAVRVTLHPAGETASATFYELAEATPTRAETQAQRYEAEEKERKRQERILNRAKQDFLISSLARVKKADADDFAMRYVLDRVVSYSTAREICTLLDLEVPTKEETSYDGKVRNVKQYAPTLFSTIAQAREDGDIGMLRRIVVAAVAAAGHQDLVLEHYGFDEGALDG